MAFQFYMELMPDTHTEPEMYKEKGEYAFYGVRAAAWDPQSGVRATTAGLWGIAIRYDEPQTTLDNPYLKEVYEEELNTLRTVLGV